jgi:starch synthase (maltosyl-transferring)
MLKKEMSPSGKKNKPAGVKSTGRKSHDELLKIFSDSLLCDLVERNSAREDLTEFAPALEIIVDRVRARYAAWYEIFPRSQGRVPGKSGTFGDCIARLPEIKEMGFDVVYLTPIHPIGVTKRKGPNNSLTASPGDPGSPYAIGNATGGHMNVEPGLGAIEDFRQFERACRDIGMELAMDFAINCSPDHPYVLQHPDWFFKRPDGSIKYAENPPKKYEDIYPLNFYAPDGAWKSLWVEMRDIIMFWVQQGVKIFRVDNPHTKPVPFWRWLIEDIHRAHPDVIFLAEAFTRPPMMRALAKAGFTQSYTYFTWRNFKGELTEYFTELTQSHSNEYMRGNLFANTPDILPKMLQEDGRAAFKMRLVLAATLSSVYGIYSGFELCENSALDGKEEYLNSEKYEFVVWDWDRPGNIKDFIASINKIRRENPALHLYKNLRFYHADDENVLFYGKATADGKNIVLVAVNLDPFGTHDSILHIPIEDFGIKPDENYELHNLITGQRSLMTGDRFHVSLNPDIEPAYLFRLERWGEKEEKFDYFGM